MRKKRYFLSLMFSICFLLFFLKDDFYENQIHYYIDSDLKRIECNYWYCIVILNIIIIVFLNFTDFKKVLSKKFQKKIFTTFIKSFIDAKCFN